MSRDNYVLYKMRQKIDDDSKSCILCGLLIPPRRNKSSEKTMRELPTKIETNENISVERNTQERTLSEMTNDNSYMRSFDYTKRKEKRKKN